MKPYNKKQKKGKFEKEKLNKKIGLVIKTKSSVLEAKNTNLSLKKSIRQQSRKEIKEIIDFNRRADEIDETDKGWLALRNTGY